MVICKIWDADYPWDVRVEKVCRSLRQKHSVHLICRNTTRQPTYEELDGIHIHRLPFVSPFFGKINRIIGFPAFFNPLWLFVIWRTVRRSQAEMILVRDLPMALAAIMLGRWFEIPVVLDMAENYPAMIRDIWKDEGFSLRNAFVRNPLLVDCVEKITIRHVDHILVMVEESRERLIGLGVSPEKISIVMNTPALDRLSDSPRMSEAMERKVDDLILVYLGLLESHRGLETAIRGVAEALGKLPHLRFLILGTGRDKAYFEALVADIDVGEHVRFLGWMEYRQALAYVTCADIGIVPHHARDSWNTTAPNKLFDYMSMGKPVIVSNAKPTERIVTEEKCGLVFRDRDPRDLADAIIALSDPSIRREQGRRGKAAVMRRYNWSVDQNLLLIAIELAAQSRGLKCAALLV